MNTEIHFLPTHESYTHALSRNTKYLTIDGLFFVNTVKPVPLAEEATDN